MYKRYYAQYQTSWNRFVHSKLWYSEQKSNFEKKILILFNFSWHFREWFLFRGIGPAELKTGYQFITLRTNTNIYGDKKDFSSYRFCIFEIEFRVVQIIGDEKCIDMLYQRTEIINTHKTHWLEQKRKIRFRKEFDKRTTKNIINIKLSDEIHG